MLKIHELFGGATGQDLIEFERLCHLARKYYAPTTADRLFKVPVETADSFSRLVNRFKLPGIKIKRRAGGPRHDSMRMTCLVKDAKYFNYYLVTTRKPYVEPLRVDPVESNKELLEICGLYHSSLDRVEQIINDYDISLVDATWLRGLALNNG